jgi:hypothetical protein
MESPKSQGLWKPKIIRGKSGSLRHGVLLDTCGFMTKVADSSTLQTLLLRTLFSLPLIGSVS